MAKRKLLRFEQINSFNNVFQHVQIGPSLEDFLNKGKWLGNVFKNKNPIVLELGCGKGEYTIGLSQKYINKNFIGVDLKGNRIYVGAKKALDEKYDNVAFLRTRIDHITKIFAENEIDEIWITFPDPQPQKTRIKKRLTSPVFLNKYKQVLKPNSVIHLKTDSDLLYNYTLDIITEQKHNLILSTNDLYSETDTSFNNAQSIQTYYESMFRSKGMKINYIQFKLKTSND